jgi:hypothetical protein
MDSSTSLDYLTRQLPKQRKLYTFAPNLYEVELAHIDAVEALAVWAHSDGRSDTGLTDVLDQFARAYGWSIADATKDADG